MNKEKQVNKKKKVRRWRKRAGICLMAGLLLLNLPADASLIEQNQDKLDDVRENMDRIEQEKNAVRDKLERLRKEQEDAKAYAASLQKEIDGVMSEISVMTEEKYAVLQKIDQISDELEQAGESAADQYDRMKLRIRYLYERGDTEYLELLMDSDSFSDFMSRSEYIYQISEYDRSMFDSYRETVESIASEKKILEERRAELEAWETELAAKKASLELLSEEKERELEELNGKIEQADQQIVDYDEALKSEEAEMLKIQKEIERLEEEERKKKEEEERKRREEEERRRQNEAAQSSGEAENQESGAGDTSSSGMLWPVSGCSRITSGFGKRIDPLTGEADGVLSDHKGIDIALPAGALQGAPVSAVLDGTVIISRYSSSAGNWVVLYHGNSTYTVYMHLQSLYASAGDQVSRGQTIGLVGNTGWSTGAHLHFEVRIGGFVNSSYSVDPLDYVSP